MLLVPDWSSGEEYLLHAAPELVPLINKYVPCTLKPEPQERYFGILLTGIIAQQLPPDVSLSIVNKLEELVGTPITPQAILAATDDDLNSCGIISQKISYMKGFAQAVNDGEITINNFDQMTDNEIIKQLTQIKGLGQWTVEMFLLLALCRTDILPTADFKFQKRTKELYSLTALPKRKQAMELTEHWRPWRSLAVWYLWQIK